MLVARDGATVVGTTVWMCIEGGRGCGAADARER